MNVVISYIFTGAIIVILFVFCEPLYHMFTTDPKVIEIGVYMLRFLIPSYLLSVLLENLVGRPARTGRCILADDIYVWRIVLCKTSVDHDSYEDPS